MSPRIFGKNERLSDTQESVIRYSFNMISSSIYKIAAAGEAKYPAVTHEQLPFVSSNPNITTSQKANTVSDNHTGGNFNSINYSHPEARQHVANAAFAATSTLDMQQAARINEIKENITNIHEDIDIAEQDRGRINAA